MACMFATTQVNQVYEYDMTNVNTGMKLRCIADKDIILLILLYHYNTNN